MFVELVEFKMKVNCFVKLRNVLLSTYKASLTWEKNRLFVNLTRKKNQLLLKFHVMNVRDLRLRLSFVCL